MNIPGIIQEIGAAAAASPVCGRLAGVSIEVAVLALAVWGLIHFLRIRSARVCSLLWILVLAKGLLGLAFGAPFELAGLHVAAPSGAGQTVAAGGMTAEELALRDEEIRRALSEMESSSTATRNFSSFRDSSFRDRIRISFRDRIRIERFQGQDRMALS